METNTKKPSSLLSNVNIVGKRKIWLIIPSVIVALALVFGTIWGFVFGSPLNLSMDFAGGYTMTVNLSTKLTVENFPDYKNRIDDIAKNLADDEGNVYGLVIDQMQHQGMDDPTKASILIRYKAIQGSDSSDSAYMEEVNERFKEELDKLFVFLPAVTLHSGIVTAVYASALPDVDSSSLPFDATIRQQAAELGIEVVAITVSTDGKTLFVECVGDVTNEKAEQFLTISDSFSGKTTEGNVITPLVGAELLVDAILAILLALTLMLVYITFRFEGSSGFVAVIALIHDIVIMLAFMVIFRVEIGGTFIAALITILGYSITNTIILFDRVREKLRPYAGKAYNPDRIANESVRDVFKRALITTITTLIPITVIALIGVSSIQIFAFPIIIGLIAGMFSTICLAPSFWTMWKNHLIKKAPAGVVIAPAPKKMKVKSATSASNKTSSIQDSESNVDSINNSADEASSEEFSEKTEESVLDEQTVLEEQEVLDEEGHVQEEPLEHNKSDLEQSKFENESQEEPVDDFDEDFGEFEETELQSVESDTETETVEKSMLSQQEHESEIEQQSDIEEQNDVSNSNVSENE